MIGRAILLAIGLPVALVAIAMVCWAGVAYFNPQWGYEAAAFALALMNAIAPGPAFTLQQVMKAIAPGPGFALQEVMKASSLGIIAAAAATVFLIAQRMVSRALYPRPARESTAVEDWTHHIRFSDPARCIGRPLAGQIRFLGPQPIGVSFIVDLRCARDTGTDSGWQTLFSEQRTTQPLKDPDGWLAPFAFDIPSTAHASGSVPGLQWSLRVSRSDRPSDYREHRITIRADPVVAARINSANPDLVRVQAKEAGRAIAALGRTLIDRIRQD